MTRDEMLLDIYNFYKKITRQEIVKSFEHYKAISSSKTDQDITDQWLFIKKLEVNKKV